MKIAPFKQDAKYDETLPVLIEGHAKRMVEGEDDALFLYVGNPGSGKSTLMLHCIEIYCPDPDPNYIALRKQDFARVQHEAALDRMKRKKKRVWDALDEANISRRQAMSEWVVDNIELFMTNRVFGILHFMCWPVAKLIERTFIEERVTGVYFCFTKSNKFARAYAYFRKDDLLRMIDDGHELTTFNLTKYMRQYACYVGRYRKYTGKLLERYKEIKVESALRISESFRKKWSEEEKGGNPTYRDVLEGQTPDRLTMKQVALKTKLPYSTIHYRMFKAIQKGLINPTKTGKSYQFTDAEVEVMQKIR